TLLIWRHALKNASLPVITVITLDLPALFSGAVVIESIFAWPGMGRLFLESAARFDYAVLMGVVTISAALVIASTFLADLFYCWLDPRIRLARPSASATLPRVLKLAPRFQQPAKSGRTPRWPGASSASTAWRWPASWC